jgi:hypothetical protein
VGVQTIELHGCASQHARFVNKTGHPRRRVAHLTSAARAPPHPCAMPRCTRACVCELLGIRVGVCHVSMAGPCMRELVHFAVSRIQFCAHACACSRRRSMHASIQGHDMLSSLITITYTVHGVKLAVPSSHAAGCECVHWGLAVQILHTIHLCLTLSHTVMQML